MPPNPMNASTIIFFMGRSSAKLAFIKLNACDGVDAAPAQDPPAPFQAVPGCQARA
jgi:hypothetical protein